VPVDHRSQATWPFREPTGFVSFYNAGGRSEAIMFSWSSARGVSHSVRFALVSAKASVIKLRSSRYGGLAKSFFQHIHQGAPNCTVV